MATPEPPAPSPAPSSSPAPASTPVASPAPAVAPSTPAPPARPASRRSRLILASIALLLALIAGGHWVVQSWGTVSTDDAYVNGHVTFVAPRIAGQVARVLVDDNNHVHIGDLLVELDKTPYQVLVDIAQAAVIEAQANLTVAQAQARSTIGQARSLRFNLDHAIEDVDNQVALLQSKVAIIASQQATLDKTQSEYDRATHLVGSGAVSEQELEDYKEAYLVAQAQLEVAYQDVYQLRVALGLPAKPTNGTDLAQVPADLDQTFSAVKQAQASLMEAIAPLGVTDSYNLTPKQMIADFYSRDPSGDIDKIYAKLLIDAPGVKQAEAELGVAQRQLDQAQLNLSYCDVVAEIDGVVTRRDVNPGNNVIPGQSLMAVRSLKEIWIDANFKETQLAQLRIGLPVDLEVDMYGSRHKFAGRISGFTNGTGSTLALLPPENATGNFVKVVQRLPVRIDLVDYHPDQTPLFVGLSVTPIVDLNATPTGPDAGKVLQPYTPAAAPAASAPDQKP
jgi:membrane fusion protein (multidrug efflux system)